MSFIDNFLCQTEFKSIKETLDSNDFPWYFLGHVADPTDNSDLFFVHSFYKDYKINSHYFSILSPILDKVKPNAIIRIKANLYVGRDKLIEHGRHTDFEYPHKTFILYLNTNDGFTRLHDGQCINSVENRALFFDGSLEHSSTNCTDQKTRKILTISYF